QPQHPPACRRGWATGQHAMQGRRRVAAAAGVVSKLLQFLSASHQHTSACAAASIYQWHGLGHAVAALYAGDGRGPDRSRLDLERGTALSRAAVAPASGAVSQPWW